MVSYKNLSLLAIAGSAMAAPAPHKRGQEVVWHTVVETAYVTVYPGQHGHGHGKPKPTPYVPAPPPAPTSTAPVVYVTEAPKPKPKSSTPPPPPPPPPSSTEAYKPEPTKEAEPAPAPPASGYMGTVDEWRSKLGLSKLDHSDQLEANAKKTCTEGNGQMVHQLNSGSMGQVLAPGECVDSEFFRVFVGGWLCERPSMPGMDGVCSSASEGWNYMGQTGHADILTSPSYSKIGCACDKGIWSCDLA